MVGHGGYWTRLEFEKVPFFDIYDPETEPWYPAPAAHRPAAARRGQAEGHLAPSADVRERPLRALALSRLRRADARRARLAGRPRARRRLDLPRPARRAATPAAGDLLEGEAAGDDYRAAVGTHGGSTAARRTSSPRRRTA